jgi:glutaredoxin-like protein NrdH
MFQWTHINGKSDHDIKLFALSTCGWCRKTKQLLDDLGVGYDFVFVDLAEPDDKTILREEIEKWNPQCSFPTLVIDNQDCIVGFNQEEIIQKLKT